MNTVSDPLVCPFVGVGREQGNSIGFTALKNLKSD